MGFEPTTSSLGRKRSSPELRPHKSKPVLPGKDGFALLRLPPLPEIKGRGQARPGKCGLLEVVKALPE